MTAKEFVLTIYPTAYLHTTEMECYEIVAHTTRTITNIRLGRDRKETGWHVIGRSECGEDTAWERAKTQMLYEMQMALEK